MTLLIGLGALGALVAVGFWLAAGVLVWRVIRGPLHLVTIYLTVISLVGIDLLLIGAIAQVLSQELAGPLFGLSMGIQVVASISAVAFTLQVRKGHHVDSS